MGIVRIDGAVGLPLLIAARGRAQQAATENLQGAKDISTAPQAGNTHSASGEVTAKEGDQVTISHGPAERFGWSAITMIFRTGSPEMVGQVNAGDRVAFSFRLDDGGDTLTSWQRADRMQAFRPSGSTRKWIRVVAAALTGFASLHLAAPAAFAAGKDSEPQLAASARTGPQLGLGEALALARGDQPGVAAFERDAIASEQAAVAARSLPDPQLSVGIQNFPIRGMNAFSPTDDEMTMYVIGVMREQVRRSRRESEAARLRAEAAVSRFEGSAQERRIQRDVMIAWIEAVEASERQRLLAQVIGDLRTGQRVIEAGISTGSSTAALELQAQAEIALADAQLADAREAEARARGELGRWIGAAAGRPLPNRLPNLSAPPDIPTDFSTHPEVLAANAQERVQRSATGVARAELRPNLSWSVMLGIRPSYGEMVSALVSIPLQINRRGLQDRKVAEAQARADAARLRTEDARRALGGQYRSALARYRGTEARITALRDRAIPSLEAAFKAAEARYAGGQGTLELPLNLVRRYVETYVQLVEQQGARARAAAELIYLSGGPIQ